MAETCTCPVCGSAVPPLPLTLLKDRGMAIHGGCAVVLTESEAAILAELLRRSPNVVTRDRLMNVLYGNSPDEEPEISVIDVFVCKLRRKLNDIGVTIGLRWGHGYLLELERAPRLVEPAE